MRKDPILVLLALLASILFIVTAVSFIYRRFDLPVSEGSWPLNILASEDGAQFEPAPPVQTFEPTAAATIVPSLPEVTPTSPAEGAPATPAPTEANLALEETQPAAPNPAPAIDPQDPRRFVMGGEPWYPAGYYPSIAALTADQTDYEDYYRQLIDKLAENDINLLRNVFTMGQPYGEAMLPYLRTGPGEAHDGRPRVDLTRFNQAYFDYWREVVTYAGSKGVVVQLTIFDSWHNKGGVVFSGGGLQREWGMKHDFYNGANNINGVNASTPALWHDPSHPVFDIQKALIREVVDNLGDLPNLIYEISNENYTNPDWELALADYLTRYEAGKGFPRHLVMPRDLPNHDSAGGKGNKPEQVHQELVSNYNLKQPLIADNDGGGHVDPNLRRQKAWAALTAGAHISYFHFDLYRLENLHSQDATDGMRYVGNTRKFLADHQVDLRGMIPAGPHVSRGWGLVQPGEHYIVYLPQGGETTLSGLPEEYRSAWFNPRDGSSQEAEGGPTFRSPDDMDWVLWVTR